MVRELAARLPGRLFDVHVHLYEQAHVSPSTPLIRSGPAKAGVDVWRRCLGKQVGAARLGNALCVPFPSRHGEVGAANRFVLEEVRRRKSLRALVLAGPRSSRSEIEGLYIP